MEQPYEFIQFDERGATGQTFGCACCSDTVEIPDLDVMAELDRTAKMYRYLAVQYQHMAGAVQYYGINRIRLAARRWHKIVEAKQRYDAAKKHRDDPGSVGDYGARWARHGVMNCRAEWKHAQAQFTRTDQRIAKALSWEEVW